MINDWILRINRKRAQVVVRRIAPFLKSNSKVIDIGSGTGNVSLLLKNKVKSVTSVDVSSFQHRRVLEPIMYDGKTLPFSNKLFDLALLLMVMHHTPNPKVVLKEAVRVSDELIVIETSYTNIFHKIYTVLADALFNLQFKINWNSYKSDQEWRRVFEKENLIVEKSRKYVDAELFLHILYHLKRKN